MAKYNPKHGFSLVEIVVSTAVIAFLMTSLFNYVSMAGTIWQKTHETITLSNEGNMLLDTIEKDLWESAMVAMPTVGATSSILQYSKRVSDYQADPEFVRLRFEVSFDPAINTVTKTLFDNTAAISALGWEDDSLASGTLGPNRVVRSHHTYTLARSVKAFNVNRKGHRLIEIDVLLGTTDSAGNEKEVRMKRTVLVR